MLGDVSIFVVGKDEYDELACKYMLLSLSMMHVFYAMCECLSLIQLDFGQLSLLHPVGLLNRSSNLYGLQFEVRGSSCLFHAFFSWFSSIIIN